jgi:hypothetical protein
MQMQRAQALPHFPRSPCGPPFALHLSCCLSRVTPAVLTVPSIPTIPAQVALCLGGLKHTFEADEQKLRNLKRRFRTASDDALREYHASL